jgi:hypothetical protein
LFKLALLWNTSLEDMLRQVSMKLFIQKEQSKLSRKNKPLGKPQV